MISTIEGSHAFDSEGRGLSDEDHEKLKWDRALQVEQALDEQDNRINLRGPSPVSF
jgi:hypothetical protein